MTRQPGQRRPYRNPFWVGVWTVWLAALAGAVAALVWTELLP